MGQETQVSPAEVRWARELEAVRRERDQIRARQQATVEILRAIANAPGEADSLRRIAEITERLFGASSVSLLVADGDRWGLTLRVGAGSERINTAIPLAHVAITSRFMPGAVYLENRQVHVPDIDDPDAVARWPGVTPARAAGTRTLVGTPLRREGRAIGALIVHRDHLAPFTDDELDLLQSFADQAAIAAENARLIKETREALERQTATADVLKVIANSPAELQPVFDAIAERANRLIGGLSTAVLRVIGDQIHLVAFTSMGEASDQVLMAQYPRPVSDVTGVGRLREGGTVQITDTEADSDVPDRIRNLARHRGYRSILYTPLILDHELIGIIVVTRREPGPFDPRHGELLKTFADQAVIAIQNARLINDTREALERQTATSDVLKVIASSPSQLQPVFDAIAERSNKLIGGFSTAVLRLQGDFIDLAAFTSTGEAGDTALKSLFPLPVAELPIIALVQSGEAAQFTDTEADAGVPVRIRDLARLRGFRSMLFAPLMSQGKPIGAISVTCSHPGAFDPRHIELLKTFADQAVIAIENARLFDEVQAKTRGLEEALERQTATSDILRVISQSPTDVQPVFDAVVGTAVRLLRCDICFVLLRSGETFSPMAAAGPQGPLPDLGPRDLPIDPGANFPSRAILGKSMLHLPDWSKVELPEHERRMQSIIGVNASLFLPLLYQDECIGLLALASKQANFFSEADIALAESFRDQALIAIQNTRLFDEVQAKTRGLEEALQQQTATADVLKVISRSAFDLDSVMNTLAHSASELCKTQICALYLREGDVLVARGVAHADASQSNFLRRTPVEADSSTYIGRTLLAGAVRNIADVQNETETGSLRKFSEVLDFRSILFVPLMREGRGIGVFALARKQTGLFSDREIELIQTFADQAVIAIENARLFGEVQARTRELSQSLEDLRAAQDRLIQTEKLASLGQLTAGIAHEIKNPLNFVNNFSSLSIELIEELLDVLGKAPLDTMARGDVDELTHMLKGNLDKVVQHGKRADSIVKNMLLHSREGSGEQRPTDVNALVEESLNLAYHGARAEKSGFNITLRRDFDSAVGMADLFPQEITRVLLNLISNGFYAATKRRALAGEDFAPELAATTRDLGGHIEIRIRDNGSGIPPEVKEKMFNPFFTTKPAGEGTGLGLSMSHDIVVKQHGGTITVETEPDVFTEFIITLPRTVAAPQTGGRT